LWAVYAINRDDGDTGTLQRRDVEILHTEPDRVYVRGLLQAGDEIVARGAHRVVPGQRVRALPDAASTPETAAGKTERTACAAGEVTP
jgi:multidrug efflux pump subunit AcrA (membrane-fusion protein)